jgi:glycosyltransferase involved in cell wall biosynthesis
MDIDTTTTQVDSLSGNQPILKHYLLVTFSIPFYIDEQGHRYLDNLWIKDLIGHFVYIKNLTLASPCIYASPPKDNSRIDNMPEFSGVKFIDLPKANSTIEGLLDLPQMISILWKAVGNNDVIHTGIAGWPIPESWVLTPIALLRKKFNYINVESAFWRLVPGSSNSLKSHIRASIVERLNCWCINHADLTTFTQDQYRQSLLTRDPSQGYVVHASWIDEEVIISDTENRDLWAEKLATFNSNRELRLLFAGRLTPEKGVLVLLEAMKSLTQSTQFATIRLDILGQGELLSRCKEASQESKVPVQIRIIGTVPYGLQFFKLMKDYHAIVLPIVSDEQPRIVYDAYSQGIPILGSSTEGIRDCVQDEKTGKLVKPNDPVALANLLKWACQNLDQLAKMGATCREAALSETHQKMHYQRWQILSSKLAGSDLG